MSALFLLSWLLAQPAPAPRPLWDLSDAERRTYIGERSKSELAEEMRTTTPDALLRMNRRALAALGPYAFTMVKQERVGGRLLDEQEIAVTIRQQPVAVRLEFVRGPKQGRKVVYNADVRAKEFRVREAGLLSIAGGLWLSLDSSMAKEDTNYAVSDSGMATLFARIEQDHQAARPRGGVAIEHEGWDASGLYCLVYVMPNGGAGFQQARTRLCTDLRTGLPGRVVAYDAKGAVLERFEFSKVHSATVTDDTFDPSSL